LASERQKILSALRQRPLTLTVLRRLAATARRDGNRRMLLLLAEIIEDRLQRDIRRRQRLAR
jgi:hypothetical protein